MRHCSMCGEATEHPTTTKPVLCKRCYRIHKTSRDAECVICHNNMKTRRTSDNPICKQCMKSARRCAICDTVIENPASVDPILCFRCYNKSHPPKTATCDNCGCLKPSHRTNDKTLCKRCYEILFLTETCARCGQERAVSFRASNGDAFCASCYYNMRTPVECGSCHRMRPKHTKHITYGDICKICYNKIRRLEDPLFALMENLRARTRSAFRRFGQGRKTHSSKEYGIDYKAIMEHIGTCPGPRSDYHVDHVFPLAAFDFDDPAHIRAAFAPENHQWLSSLDNLSKQDRYDPLAFEAYLKQYGVRE